MLLRDLEALEAAFDARGYRVAFEALVDGPLAEAPSMGEAWLPEHLTLAADQGWPTAEAAEAVAARLRRVGGAAYRHVHVVGPDGATLDNLDIRFAAGPNGSQTAPTLAPSTPPFGDETPAAATTPQPSTAPADAIPVAMGLPLGPVTVLALPAEGGPPSERALVGDGGGQVYCCFRGELEGREGVRWRAKQTTFESVNVTPDRTLDFHDLYWPQGPLAARVAFWGGEGDNGSSGLWWVLRRRD